MLDQRIDHFVKFQIKFPNDFLLQVPFDLSFLMGCLASDPYFFSSPVVQRYRDMERSEHIKKYNSTEFFDHTDLSTNYFLFGLGQMPTFKLPQANRAIVTPKMFLEDPIFDKYREGNSA